MAGNLLNRTISNDNGAALVVTLAIVAILISAALHLSKYTGDSVKVTLANKDLFEMEQLALSGINLAALILSEDAEKNSIDSVQDAWADAQIISQVINEMGIDEEALTIEISDELSKIQINALIMEFPGNAINPNQRLIWENLLRIKFSSDKNLDDRNPEKIINSVKDWLDSLDDDAVSGLSGAESDFYQELEPPYVCANGPFNHVDELLNVNGFSKDILNDANIDGDIDEPISETKTEDLFSVYGLDTQTSQNGKYRFPGKVNINTAGVDVISALLPEGREDMAQAIADYRDEKSEQGQIFLNSLDKGWYLKVIELTGKEQKQFDRTIRYSSDTFKVVCTAKRNSSQLKMIAYLKRERQAQSGKWKCRILQLERD